MKEFLLVILGLIISLLIVAYVIPVILTIFIYCLIFIGVLAIIFYIWYKFMGKSKINKKIEKYFSNFVDFENLKNKMKNESSNSKTEKEKNDSTYIIIEKEDNK